jgi:hypothetical protein
MAKPDCSWKSGSPAARNSVRWLTGFTALSKAVLKREGVR